MSDKHIHGVGSRGQWLTDGVVTIRKAIHIVRIRGWSFLSLMSLQHTFHVLHVFVQEKDEQVRIQAIDLLSRLQNHVPCSILLPFLTDASWKVRAATAEALGHRQRSFPVQAMLQAFAQEQDMTVREMIVKACAQHTKRVPVSWFTMALSDDPVWLVREAAAEALSSWGPQMPLLPLFRTVRWDEDEQVRAAALALQCLHSHDSETRNTQ